MNSRYNDVGAAGLAAAAGGLASVGHVSPEQRDRARRYVLEEADLRYPEEWQTADRDEWRDELLAILGLQERAI